MASHPNSSAQAPKLPFPEILKTSEGTVRILQNLETCQAAAPKPSIPDSSVRTGPGNLWTADQPAFGLLVDFNY